MFKSHFRKFKSLLVKIYTRNIHRSTVNILFQALPHSLKNAAKPAFASDRLQNKKKSDQLVILSSCPHIKWCADRGVDATFHQIFPVIQLSDTAVRAPQTSNAEKWPHAHQDVRIGLESWKCVSAPSHTRPECWGFSLRLRNPPPRFPAHVVATLRGNADPPGKARVRVCAKFSNQRSVLADLHTSSSDGFPNTEIKYLMFWGEF